MVPIIVSVAIVLFVPLIWGIAIYNGLVRGRVRAENGFSQIDVQLKRRCDLIPNLVEAVKGYMSHERQTLKRLSLPAILLLLDFNLLGQGLEMR